MRKNKKLLLASVAAMGALALGVGATSTFAWYGARSTATAAANNTDLESVTLTQYIANAGGVAVPLKVTLGSDLDHAERLLLAQYKDYTDAADDTAYKMLESGYIDAAGGFHEVEGDDIGTIFGRWDAGTPANDSDDEDFVLSSTLKVKIEIDWDAEYSSGNKHWSGVAGSRLFTTDGTDSYTEANIIETLQTATVDIGFKDDTTKRGRLFVSTPDSTNRHYVTVNSATLVDGYQYESGNQNKSLAGLCYYSSAVDESKYVEFSGLINYYVYGHNGGAGANGTLENSGFTITDAFGVNVIPHSA